MKIKNLYISENDSKNYKEIYDDNVTYGKNIKKMNDESGIIKNRFVNDILNLDLLSHIYLKNIKKNKNDTEDILFEISRNTKITPENYKEYIRKNGIATSKTGLILRTIDNCTNAESMCDTWRKRLCTKYGKAIIDIKACGYICKKNSDGIYEKLSCYIICKKYGDFSNVMKLCLYDSIAYLKSFLIFLNTVSQGDRDDKEDNASAICTNLRLYNYGIGYNDDDSVYFVLLDINENSILFKNTIENKIGPTKRLNKQVGISYIPYYAAKDHLMNNLDWLPRLDKIYSVALFELLMYLFFRKSRIFLELYLLMTSVIELPYDLQYYHVMRRYDDCRNKQLINKLIINLKVKYSELDGNLSTYLIYLLISLTSEKYEDIPYPGDVYKDMTVIENNANSYESLEDEAKKALIGKIGYIDKILDSKKENEKIATIIYNDEAFNMF